eukprot:2254379-Pleurochrysis_carterae.AAC.4
MSRWKLARAASVVRNNAARGCAEGAAPLRTERGWRGSQTRARLLQRDSVAGKKALHANAALDASAAERRREGDVGLECLGRPDAVALEHRTARPGRSAARQLDHHTADMLAPVGRVGCVVRAERHRGGARPHREDVHVAVRLRNCVDHDTLVRKWEPGADRTHHRATTCQCSDTGCRRICMYMAALKSKPCVLAS